MKISLKEIARLLGGTIIGADNLLISDIRPIEEAREGDLAFVANQKYFKMLKTTKASAVLAPPKTIAEGKTLIIVDDPYASFGKILSLFYPLEHGAKGVSSAAYIEDGAVVSPEATVFPRVFISRGAKIEKGVILYPGVFIGRNASVGEDSVLYANVSIYHDCTIGKRVILHAGVVIGSDGFGFAAPGVTNAKIPQVGIVQIDDDVEIGANSTVDRATMGKTWIQRNVKIDNLVQVAHNVVIGENSAIAAQAGIAGSTKLGKSVMVGGQTGILGHLNIGDYVMIIAASAVHNDVSSGQIVGGAPHLPHRQWLKVESCRAKLPEMRSKLDQLARQVEIIETKINKNK